MELYLLVVTLCYLLFIIAYVVKRVPAVRSKDGFFSLGVPERAGPLLNRLERTFEASNATFATSMLGLFGLASYNLFYALYLVLGYLLGVLFFCRVLIPIMQRHIEQGRLLTDVIERGTGSGVIKHLIGVLLAVSLLAFYYTEILAFSLLFLGEGLRAGGTELLFPPELVTVLLVLLLGAYVGFSGYRSLVVTDGIQLVFIRTGSYALLAVALLMLLDSEPDQLLALIGREFAAFPHLIMIPAIVIGLLFAQLAYYENWLRLKLFYQSASAGGVSADQFFNGAIAQYQRAIPRLLVIYLVPILLAAIAKLGSQASLYALLEQLWQHSLIGTLAVALALLAFVSALLSTADTYLLTCVHLFAGFRQHRMGLLQLRALTVVLSLSAIPFVVFQLNIGPWMQFLFYSNNGLIGPVLLTTLGYQLNRYVAGAVILAGYVIAYLCVSSELIDLIAAAMVLASLALSYITAKKPVVMQERARAGGPLG